MARSRRKTPIRGRTTAGSDRKGKKLSARAYRRAVRDSLEPSVEIVPDEKEHRDPWQWPKDGKLYAGTEAEDILRK